MAPNSGREIYRQNMQHTGFGSDPVDVAPSQKSSVRRELLQKYRGHTDMGSHDDARTSPKRMASNAPNQITDGYLQATECFSRGNTLDAGGGSEAGTIAKWMHNSRSSPPLRRQLSPGPAKCPVGRAKSPETKPEPKCIMPVSMTDELAHKGTIATNRTHMYSTSHGLWRDLPTFTACGKSLETSGRQPSPLRNTSPRLCRTRRQMSESLDLRDTSPSPISPSKSAATLVADSRPNVRSEVSPELVEQDVAGSRTAKTAVPVLAHPIDISRRTSSKDRVLYMKQMGVNPITHEGCPPPRSPSPRKTAAQASYQRQMANSPLCRPVDVVRGTYLQDVQSHPTCSDIDDTCSLSSSLLQTARRKLDDWKASKESNSDLMEVLAAGRGGSRSHEALSDVSPRQSALSPRRWELAELHPPTSSNPANRVLERRRDYHCPIRSGGGTRLFENKIVENTCVHPVSPRSLPLSRGAAAKSRGAGGARRRVARSTPHS
uniref:Uncharacterized protein n=1 Tax=Noctiluca scintillans TaxID=2966 RepID=A0A7S1FJN7_NOCSC|mmetsp:Transcript_9774/g.27266  ORF Transcript_9774/g.27266 Transcript_9774/m.27266 type:complete len:490 (+) Transcript_9774:75-1544(+)